MVPIRRKSLALGLALAATLASAATAFAQTGTITGQVTAASTGQPLAGAQVSVVGTNTTTTTNEQGRYTLRNVQARQVTVRAQRIGFSELARQVTVSEGGTATLNLALPETALQLEGIVTTVTGPQRAVEVGSAISQVDAAEVVATRPVANMSDLLTARAAGVQVLPGNATGTGARVRIRGTSSLSLSNDPIYIIDGVRMQSSTNSTSIGVGGSTPSRTNDINPEEIESIEVVKGPSAATLYGTDAANGVIVIRTKRGRVGPPQWTAYVEQGIIEDRNQYPVAYRGFQKGTTASGGQQCFIPDMARGACTQDSIGTYNLFADPRATPLGTGRRQQYGLQVAGGTEAARYFVSGEWEDEVGLLKIPEFELQRLNRDGTGIREEWNRPNALSRASARANLNVTLTPKADVAISTNYIHLNQRLPQNDNNTTGLLSNAFGGPGTRFNTNALGDTLFGYRAFAPGDIFQETVTQDVDRFLGSMTGNWRPLEWLTTRGNFGVDYTSRVDEDICRRGTCADFGTSRQGFKIDNRTNFYNYTLDGVATATYRPRSWLDTRTSVGVQFNRDVFDRNGASGSNLPPGAIQITAAAVQAANEATSESRTLGAFLEEQLSFADRLFVTAGVRSDRNSAFGAEFETVFYPKLSVSYLISDESWFPEVGFVDELRLRSAYGASGVQPGTIDAVQFYSATAGRFEGAELPGLVFNSLGNPTLRPERSTELEVGFDATLLDGRVTTEFTYYNKRSEDALIARVLPPSLGAGDRASNSDRFENLGEVRNWGFEGLISAQLLQRRSFGWDVSLNGSTNANRLVDLGEVPPIIGTTIRQVEGFPLNGYWQRPIVSFADQNGDGLIGVNEVEVGDTAVFLGYSIPRHEVTFTNGFEFLNRAVRLTALVDYKGGHMLNNGTERIRCQNRQNCQGLIDPSASPFQQARATALVAHPSRTQAGYIEDASFVRFRELALNVRAPEAWAQRLYGGSALNATLSARNLRVWTRYTGIDPESNYGQNNAPNDFQTAPPPSYVTLRVNLGF